MDQYSICCKTCFSKLLQAYEFVQECFKSIETLLSAGSFEILLINDNGPCSVQATTEIKVDVTFNDREEPTHSFREDSDVDESHILFPEECKEEECLETKCSYCKEIFEDQILLETHISNTHHPDRPHTCPICSKGFQSVSNRNTHIQSHNPAESYKCTKCQKSFRSKVYLSKHTKFVHTVAEHECKVCNKIFINAAKYKYHARSHDASKQFHCKFCARSFIQIHHLQNHERTHTGQVGLMSILEICLFLLIFCSNYNAPFRNHFYVRCAVNDSRSLAI